MVRRAGILLLGCALPAGCDNMQHQGARRISEDTPRPAPAHAVARGAPLASDPFETGWCDGVPLARNPRLVTAELLARGRERFDIHCAACHGRDGYGTGIVVRRGFPAPPSFHIERLRGAPDGRLFDAITRGSGVMLPCADRVTPADRWAIVAYIRALQLSQHATLADAPPAERARLLSP